MCGSWTRVLAKGLRHNLQLCLSCIRIYLHYLRSSRSSGPSRRAGTGATTARTTSLHRRGRPPGSTRPLLYPYTMIMERATAATIRMVITPVVWVATRSSTRPRTLWRRPPRTTTCCSVLNCVDGVVGHLISAQAPPPGYSPYPPPQHHGYASPGQIGFRPRPAPRRHSPPPREICEGALAWYDGLQRRPPGG